MTAMQAAFPFFDAPEDALRAAVQAMGGAKQVGARIWPDKTPDAAGRLLLDCLNSARAEKLEIGQIMMILRESAALGHHEAMQWIAGQIGYETRHVPPAEEIDRLTSVIEQSSHTLAAALATLERLQRVRSVA